MKHQTSRECSATERQFLEALRQQPELLRRFQIILELTRNADGPVQTADAVEEQLIEALRQLGHESMNQWAARAAQRVSTELEQQDVTVRWRKKTLTWWCVFGLVRVRDQVWRSAQQRYLRPLPARLGVTPRGKSRRLERVLTDFGCEHSFEGAAAVCSNIMALSWGPVRSGRPR